MNCPFLHDRVIKFSICSSNKINHRERAKEGNSEKSSNALTDRCGRIEQKVYSSKEVNGNKLKKCMIEKNNELGYQINHTDQNVVTVNLIRHSYKLFHLQNGKYLSILTG